MALRLAWHARSNRATLSSDDPPLNSKQAGRISTTLVAWPGDTPVAGRKSRSLARTLDVHPTCDKPD